MHLSGFDIQCLKKILWQRFRVGQIYGYGLRINVKMTFLIKGIYWFNEVLTKNPIAFFIDIEKAQTNLYGRTLKKTKITKVTLKKADLILYNTTEHTNENRTVLAQKETYIIGIQLKT